MLPDFKGDTLWLSVPPKDGVTGQYDRGLENRYTENKLIPNYPGFTHGYLNVNELILRTVPIEVAQKNHWNSVNQYLRVP